MAKTAVDNKKTIFTSELDVNLSKELVKCHIWSIAVYGVANWTLREVDQKYLDSCKMWRWRRMEKISWTDGVKNDIKHMVKEEIKILHNWIDQIWRKTAFWNTLLKKKEGEVEVTGIRGRRCKQLVYGLKENRRCCKLKDEALNLTLWRNRSGRGYRPLVRHYMIMTKLPHTKTHLLKECSHASVQKQHGEDLNQQCTL